MLNNKSIALLSALVSNNFAVAALNDTGVTSCSNATEDNLACPVTDFPRQDAEYGPNAFNFTKIDAAGLALPATATDHTCVWDNTTGLVWEVKAADGGLRDKNWTYTWYNSTANIGTASGGTCHAAGRCDTEKFVADVNAAGLCGFTDWRLPNVKELIGIVNYQAQGFYDANYFPNTSAAGGPYWTAPLIGNAAWSVQGGSSSYDDASIPSYFVRLVRGAESVAAFTDNGNGTVTDSSTGLMWAKCVEGKTENDCAIGSGTIMNWGAALTAGQNSRLAGYNDWRLPNIKELLSLSDYVHYGPNIYQDYFPNSEMEGFSSTPSGSAIMGLNIDVGAAYYGDRNRDSFSRLVRTNGPLTNAMNGHTYQYFNSAVDWNGAKDNCAGLGGYLATITSQQEQDWIVNKFGTDTQIWLGGTDEGHEGTWTWVTGEPWDYTNWNPGEPNGVESENCTHIERNVDDRWNDLACSANKRYLCEWNLSTGGLVAYYPFNGNANDASGNANNGTVHGATLTADRFGIENSAYQFDGIDDYIQFDQHIVPTSGDFSVAFFAKEITQNDGFVEIISQGFNDGSGFYVGYDPNHYFRIGDELQDTGIPFPSDGIIHHYAVTAGSDTRLYIDGILTGTFVHINDRTVDGTHTRIGAQFEAYGEFFHGTIDDIRIYNRALSADEITQLYTLGATTVYNNDFSTSAGAEWTDPTIADYYGEKILARSYLGFGAETNTLTLNNLPDHTQATVSFDLYAIFTWDGNGDNGAGPDNWQLTADDVNLLFTNFANETASTTQAYPHQLPPYGTGGKFAPRTGAFKTWNMGWYPDAIYRLSYTFTHTAPSLKLAFHGMAEQGPGDEGWGLDNVRVDVLSTLPPPTTTLALNITTAGTGSGTVTSDPAGINCGEDCTENYAQGTVVTLTATPTTIMCVTTPCPKHIFAGWSGDADCSDGKVTMNAVKNCTATFNLQTHTITPIADPAIGGTVTPNTPQIVNYTETKAFTVTPAAAYTKNAAVMGTCPQGSWNGNIWTTGVITANCTVIFGFTLKTYTVIPAAGTGGTVTPNTPQTVNHGATKAFTLTVNSGYTKNNTVTGNCPQGSWNGNLWTTGTIVTNCTVNFGFTPLPANAWLNPPNSTVIRNQPFILDVIVNSNSLKLGSYAFNVTWNATKLVLDTSQCPQGVCPGANAVDNRVNIVNDAGSITLTGSDNTSVGPGNDLQLLKLHFKTQLTTGATPVNLTTTTLKTPEGGNIGLQARGATVNVSYGLCGDSDGNARVNIVDALAIARKLVGLPPPPTVDEILADVNKNARLDINDALMIARYSIGLVIPPEVCNIGQPL